MRETDFEIHSENRYSQAEEQKIKDFSAGLERRVIGLRELFFWSADSHMEREENDEVRMREKRGDREFDYQRAVVELTLKLAGIEPEKRREIMQVVQTGIRYTVKGVYVNRPSDIPGHNTEPLFSDFAQNPLKYVS